MRKPLTRLLVMGMAIVQGGTAVADPLLLYPVQTGAETLRYRTGIPTLTLATPAGAIQITPLPFLHAHPAVAIGVYNSGQAAANFGIENIAVTVQGAPVPVLSSEELQKREKSRAMWSQIALAALSAGAAAAASTAHNTNRYSSTTTTPFGTYHSVATWRDNTPGVLGASAATAAGIVAIAGVQQRLDYTLANLATDVVATTTIDPQSSYGGQVVIENVKAKPPYDLSFMVHWNGVDYPFVFRVTKAGMNLPPPYTTPPTPVQLPGASGALPPPASPPRPNVSPPTAPNS